MKYINVGISKSSGHWDEQMQFILKIRLILTLCVLVIKAHLVDFDLIFFGQGLKRFSNPFLCDHFWSIFKMVGSAAKCGQPYCLLHVEEGMKCDECKK